jgi:hypothetical protein
MFSFLGKSESGNGGCFTLYLAWLSLYIGGQFYLVKFDFFSKKPKILKTPNLHLFSLSLTVVGEFITFL